MFDLCISVLGAGLVFTLLAFVRALPLLVIALVVTLLLRRRIAARYQFLLWMVVGARMLMPFSVPSPVSIHGPLEQLASAMVSGTSDAESPEPNYLTEDVQTNGETPPQTISEFMDMPRQASPSPRATPAASIDWEFVVAVSSLSLWSLGVVLLLSRGVIAHVRFALRVRSCPPIEDQFVRSPLLEECDSIGLRRPKVVEAAFLQSPAVFGFWKPTICLPVNLATQLSEQELRWVLRHELAHIKRRDSLWLSVAFLMRALHWYNPLAWFVASRLQALAEESADDVAVRNSQQDTWTDYARMLLHFAEKGGPKPSRAAVGLLCMAAGNGLPKRIEMLIQRRPTRLILTRVFAWLAIVGLAIVGLTDQMVVADAEYYVEADQWEAANNRVPIHASARRDEKGATSPRKRNVEELLAKLKDEFDIPNPESFLLELVKSQSQLPASIKDGNLMVQLSDVGMLEVDNMLAAMMTRGPRQVVIQCTSWQGELPPGDPEGWFEDRIETPPGSLQHCPIVAAKLSGVLASKIRLFSPGQKLVSPKVIVMAGTTGIISIGPQRAFVTDVKQVASNAYQGVFALVTDGTEIQLQAFPADDNACDLKCVLTNTDVEKVQRANLPDFAFDAHYKERESTMRHGNQAVEVPVIHRSSVRTEATLEVEEHLLLAVPTLGDEVDEKGPAPATFYLISQEFIPLKDTLQEFTR